MRKNFKMTLTAPTGDVSTATLPRGAAWAAARGIAEHTHFDVVLHGEYGDATFHNDGTGQVRWNAKSTTPGEYVGFGKNTTVAI